VLTTSEDKTARLWEAESDKLLAAFQGHTEALSRTVFGMPFSTPTASNTS
jgi:hypothetical protein